MKLKVIMSYLPFNDEWKKEVSKMSIKMIKTLFPEPLCEGLKLKKVDLINKLRAQLIAKQFNELFPVGCSLLWKPTSRSNPIEVTVEQQAYIASSGEPVAFFKERSGYCSISPEFISISSYSYQFKINQ